MDLRIFSYRICHFDRQITPITLSHFLKNNISSYRIHFDIQEGSPVLLNALRAATNTHNLISAISRFLCVGKFDTMIARCWLVSASVCVILFFSDAQRHKHAHHIYIVWKLLLILDGSYLLGRHIICTHNGTTSTFYIIKFCKGQTYKICSLL